MSPTPESLRPHYTRFLRDGRILLSGHSHQAWPDVAREGQLDAFDDAAAHVDDKWGRAFEACDAVRAAVATHFALPASRAKDVALSAATLELVGRVLSCVDVTRRRHVLTTRGEFHTAYRLFSRLAESGVEVEMLDALPVATLAERLAARVRDDTACVFVSTILFETSTAVPHLGAVRDAAEKRGALVVLDAYHQAAVRAFDPGVLGGNVFVTGGGYKYLEWGEGNAFLIVPEACTLRPVLTGWFADFGNLTSPRGGRAVGYGDGGAARFAGATFDPTSQYRARRVAHFFDEVGLTPDALHASYRRQTSRLLASLDTALANGARGLGVVSPRDDSRGGFVAVKVTDAPRVVAALKERGVFTDSRGPIVRVGPAPYVTDAELDAGIAALVDVARVGP